MQTLITVINCKHYTTHIGGTVMAFYSITFSYHATRMFMAYAPNLPIVSLWQLSIHIQKPYQSWRQLYQYPPGNGYLSNFRQHQTL